MKHRLYAMERAAVIGLLDTTREMFAAARGMRAEDMRAAIADIYASARMAITPTTPEQIAASYTVDRDGVAHIPIVGVLTPAANPCAALFGGAETEYGYIAAASRAADADPRVTEIAYEINSPGGYVDGVDGAAQAIAGVSKPTVSHVHDMAASAAYWIGAQADRMVAMSPASRVGSIGVVAEEYDYDEAYARDGITHRVYTSTDAPDKRPDTKTPEGRARVIDQLDDLHRVFVQRVADARGVTPERVNADFGRGAVVIASDALKAGMIDGVEGLRIKTPGVAGKNAAEQAAETQEEVKVMDLNQLKREHPDVYGAAVAEGVAQERGRVAGLRKWDKPACASIVSEAIAAGKSEGDVLPQLMAAMQTVPNDTPPPVNPAKSAGAAGAGTEGADAMTEDQVADRMRAIIHGEVK